MSTTEDGWEGFRWLIYLIQYLAYSKHSNTSFCCSVLLLKPEKGALYLER